jgi:hypothetical protein
LDIRGFSRRGTGFDRGISLIFRRAFNLIRGRSGYFQTENPVSFTKNPTSVTDKIRPAMDGRTKFKTKTKSEAERVKNKGFLQASVMEDQSPSPPM